MKTDTIVVATTEESGLTVDSGFLRIHRELTEQNKREGQVSGEVGFSLYPITSVKTHSVSPAHTTALKAKRLDVAHRKVP